MRIFELVFFFTNLHLSIVVCVCVYLCLCIVYMVQKHFQMFQMKNIRDDGGGWIWENLTTNKENWRMNHFISQWCMERERKRLRMRNRAGTENKNNPSGKSIKESSFFHFFLSLSLVISLKSCSGCFCCCYLTWKSLENEMKLNQFSIFFFFSLSLADHIEKLDWKWKFWWIKCQSVCVFFLCWNYSKNQIKIQLIDLALEFELHLH